MTDSSQTSLAYIVESSYGVTPATPAYKQLRFTGEAFDVQTQYVSSNEIRNDRNVADTTLVAREANGNINFELSYGSYDDFLEALLQGTWTSNVLKNGVMFRSFSFEKIYKPLAGNQYHRFIGQVPNTMSLNVKARDMVTGSLGFMGKDASSAQAIIVGATYIAPNSNPIINASNNISGVAITGIANPQVMEINLNIDNNMRQQPVIGSLNAKGIGTGRCEVKGSIKMYFETQAAYELFLADTYTDLTFTLGGASNLKYTIALPRIKLIDTKIETPGNDQDIFMDIPFTAIYNATDAATIKITRTP